MIIPSTLLLSALCLGTPQEPVLPLESVARASSAGQQRISTGIVLSAAVEGSVAICDTKGRLVVELDKPAGRQLEMALAPGGYTVEAAPRAAPSSRPPCEAGLGPASPNVVRFHIGDGDTFVLEMPRPGAPEPVPPPPGPPPPSAPPRALDARQRIEVRFGGWADGWSDGPDDWDFEGSAQGAFGVEYLHFLRNDLGVGLALTTYGQAEGWSGDWDEQGTAQGLVSLPIVARWYPVRRLTATRSVEPYVSAGVGPVFGFNSAWADCTSPCGWELGDGHGRDDRRNGVSRSRVSTALGGRLGGGVDFRLGSIFTLGMAGAWNWNTGFPDDLWYRPEPGGGEFTVTMGWQFGR